MAMRGVLGGEAYSGYTRAHNYWRASYLANERTQGARRLAQRQRPPECTLNQPRSLPKSWHTVPFLGAMSQARTPPARHKESLKRAMPPAPPHPARATWAKRDTQTRLLQYPAPAQGAGRGSSRRPRRQTLPRENANQALQSKAHCPKGPTSPACLYMLPGRS